MSEILNISFVKDFSKYPAGRYKKDGQNSAERFRDDILIPALESGYIVHLDMDGAVGYPISFLQEVFGELKRILISKGFDLMILDLVLKIHTQDQFLKDQISFFMKE